MGRAVVLFVTGLLIFGLNTAAYAELFSVSDGGWSITVDTMQQIRDDEGTESEGLVNWKDPSGYDYVFQDSWWGRDSTALSEGPLSSLELTSSSTTANTILVNLRDNGPLLFDLSYELTGSGLSSSVLEKATLTNSGTDPLSLSLFKYADFDLCYGYTAHDDDYASGDTSGITQYDAYSTVSVDPAVSVEPDAFQISLASGTGSIISSLNDSGVTNLTGGGSPFGSGDASFAFQWDFTLNSGQSYTIENMKTLTTTPEPVSSVLFLVGGISLAVARYRKRRNGS